MSEEKTVKFPFQNQEQYGGIRTIAEQAGIELRGDDGQPHCCGENMPVKAGLMGPDLAHCNSCGKEIRNAASPHVNGGYLLTGEVMEKFGEFLWTTVQPGS